MDMSDQYRLRDDNRPDMESVSASETPTNLSSLDADIFKTIWSQFLLPKRQQIFPRWRPTSSKRYGVKVSASETPTNLSSLDADIFHTTIDRWAEVTSWGLRDA